MLGNFLPLCVIVSLIKNELEIESQAQFLSFWKHYPLFERKLQLHITHIFDTL